MAEEQFSDGTLWLTDAIARYWAAVWCQATGDEWVLHRSRIRGDSDRNRPVLKRHRGNPITPTGTCALRSLKNSPRASDQELRELFDLHLARLHRASES